MPTDELKEFVEERLRAYDPTIDLTDGSPAEVQIVDPIVNRFMPDPFEMDVDKFVEARLSQEYPDLDTREGTAVRDMLVKPNVVLLDPIQREVTLIKQNQSMANPELLAPSEADALAANLIVRRSMGSLAAGRVRLYFNAPMALTVSMGNIFYTADGLNFRPTSMQSISADAMLFNQEGNLYYFDVNVTAESPGSQYNIDAASLVGVSNINTAVRVTNLDKFTGGLDEEDTETLVGRAAESVTERSMVIGRGVVARLKDQFTELQQIQTIGFGDEEMERDIMTGGDMGPILLSGSDGYTDDDGDGDDESLIFGTWYTGFLATFSGVGVVENYYLTASEIAHGDDGEVPGGARLSNFVTASYSFRASDVGLVLVKMGATNLGNNGISRIAEIIGEHEVRIEVLSPVAETGISWFLARPATDHLIEEILTSNSLRVSASTPLPASRYPFVWEVRKKELTISDIPGGIQTPTVNGVVAVQSSEVHIGGHSDFFVRGATLEDAQITLTSVVDEDPLIDKQTLETDLGTLGAEYVKDSTVDFFASGVKPGYSLIIESGPNAGTRTILKVTSLEPNQLQVSPVVVSTLSGQKYRIIDDIDIDLRDPRNVKCKGVDLQTLQLSSTVTTAAAIDFSLYGVAVGDTLRILTGPDAGDYLINQITGTGNKKLVVSGQMTATRSNVGWQVFTKQTGMDFPLVRITSVDLLDSSRQPTGEIIPYANPVDVRTSAFSNMGRGTKVSASDIITGIVGTVDMGGAIYPLPTCVLSVQINNASPLSIPLTGSVSGNEVINRINAYAANIAQLIDVEGEYRLALRSRNRWIRVLSGANNGVVGFDVTVGEDNRQIKSASSVSDWSIASYDIKAIKDVVSIQTGDNIGNYHLVAVNAGRLLVLGVDNGAATFLQPNTNVLAHIGSRSYGMARLYFMDPTSCSVRGAFRPPLVSTGKNPANYAWTESGATALLADDPPLTYFTATVNGAALRFIPDPDLKYPLSLTDTGDVPNNLKTVSGDFWVACDAAPSDAPGQGSRVALVDFLAREILPGDLLEITHIPIQGSKDLSDPDHYSTAEPPPANCLKHKTLIMAVDGAPMKACTFSDQITGPSDVVDEINEAFGLEIAHLETVSGAPYLRLEADVDFTLFGNGTANGDRAVVSPPSPATLLGLGHVTLSNQAQAHIDGYYHILEVGQTTSHHKLYVVKEDGTSAPSVTEHSQHFSIYRPGLQRLHTKAMKDQTEFGFYYMDVELVSEGVGDQCNLAAGLQMEVLGQESDGYSLYTPDASLTFSEEEEITMSLSRRILLPSVSDNPSSATKLYSSNIQINYERSLLAAQIQSFASSELERVLTANILVRHLMPHFVSFSLRYQGGSTTDIVSQDLLDYLTSLSSTDRVEVSSITDIVKRRGAAYTQMPITLIAVVHMLDRSISVDRSQDYVSKGRLATFFPGNITVVRDI